MQKYREINGNDYVKDSRATINETMQSIQSMNSGTAFPTTNLFEGMKCYRTDLKKTYTLTDVENGTWVEDAHATLADTATKLQTPRTLSLTGKVAGSSTFDGSANASINVTSVNADTASKLSTARKINITGNATGSAAFDGSGDVSISTTVNESKHAAAADTLKSSEATETSTVARPVWLSWEGDNTKMVVSPNLTYTCSTKTLAAANFKGHLAGNADSATKLATARAISLTGNASGSASFDGSGNVSINTTVSQAANADKVDGVHAASLFYNKGDWDANNWATIGTYEVRNNPPVSDAYSWGQVISISTALARFQLYASHLMYKSNGRLRYRTGFRTDSYEDRQPWNTILDSENYNLFAPTKTGGGASGTWGINISGNAASATTATTATTANGLSGDLVFPDIGNTNISRKISWGGSTDGADIYYQTTASDQGNLVLNLRDDPNCYLRIAASGAFKSYFSPDGVFHGTATNADTVDGYHASDIINRISAANTGGIVAASLTENGYAKFANGLILQWGFVSNTKATKNYDITFPVSFASACFGVHNTYFKSSGEAGKSGDNWDTVAKITKYGCQLSADNQNVFWTAIGV